MKNYLKYGLCVFLVCFCAFSCSAKTLIPLPGEVGILPDFPNAQVSEYYDFGLQEWATGITTEIARWKCLYAGLGWTTSKDRWLLTAGVELTNLDSIGLNFNHILSAMPLSIKIKFFMTYSSVLVQDRYFTAGAGFDIIGFSNK